MKIVRMKFGLGLFVLSAVFLLSSLIGLPRLCVSCFESTAFSSLANPPKEKDQEESEIKLGYYRCKVAAPGRERFLLVAIRKPQKTAGAYLISYHTAGATLITCGYKHDRFLSVGWGDGNSRGVAVYRIQHERLEGKSVHIPSDDLVWTEVLTWLAPFVEGEE